MNDRNVVLFILILNNAIFLAAYCTFHDYSGDSNHLDCRGKELVNIYGINAYKFPKSLDLSHNEFTKISDNQFQETQLIKVEKLSFSFNKIWHVGSLAFNGLSMLKTLDLSHNKIKTINLLFWPDLISLNVSFNFLDQSSIIKCTTLEILDISNNHLEKWEIAEDITNMKHLNITNNKIASLPSQQFLQLNLASLRIRGNKIRCDAATTNLLEYLVSRGVQVSPTCPPILSSSVPIFSTPKVAHNEDHILTPTSAVLAPIIENDSSLKLLEDNQSVLKRLTLIVLYTQIAVIALLISVFVLLIIFRLRDSTRKSRRLVIPLEDLEGDAPPPPYRTNSSGFII